MRISIVIASHGDEAWRELAWSRAYPSALGQGAHEVLIKHDPEGTRAAVRNELSERATGDWIVTLDADDELAAGFVESLALAYGALNCCEEGELRRRHTLLVPAVSYVRNGRVKPPMFWPETDLTDRNWIPVGAAVPRWLLLSVGGWRTMTGTGTLNEWDDFDLWIRCVKAGAMPVKVPEAVYLAHVSGCCGGGSRASRKMGREWIREIQELNGIAVNA